ncbi:unnamed protein product [Pseudo-nitzschia multistriata]|uniref:Uncharacterized protein n=1 Tax=Pseudo-nitzschia multistriata TaxID=183589 RepID=A0A448Z8D8_9STRA|nr:unnamed protein product [Pseudo-nitzschia multistriata]
MFSESNYTHKPRRVQFGIPSAVEYEIDRPAGHLTPLSQEVTKKRYSMDPKKSTREEQAITQETKENNLILSEWEDQFSVNRSKTSRLSSKRKKKNRRSSSIFSPGSRLSLDYDNTDEKICDEERTSATKEPHNVLTSRLSDSPSDLVATNLASLSMSPPKLGFDERDSSATPQAMPVASAGSENEHRTWDCVADLGTINSNGAMELSPHMSNSSMIELTRGSASFKTMSNAHSKVSEEQASFSQTADLDSINAFGGALDQDSPNRGPNLPTDSSTSNSSSSRSIGVVSDVMLTNAPSLLSPCY